MLKNQVAVFIHNRGYEVTWQGDGRVPGILQQFPYPPGEYASAVRLVRLEVLQYCLCCILGENLVLDSIGTWLLFYFHDWITALSPGLTKDSTSALAKQVWVGWSRPGASDRMSLTGDVARRGRPGVRLVAVSQISRPAHCGPHGVERATGEARSRRHAVP